MSGNKKTPQARAKGDKTKPDANPKQKASQGQGSTAQEDAGDREQGSSKTAAQISREARKRQRRKERIAMAKKEHCRSAEERWAAGERPWKPCHLCREEGHWDRDCPKYGAWKAKMDAKRG